jgi:serine/threonine-protein kinase HSL1, negative regulator of Swe1 kinase
MASRQPLSDATQRVNNSSSATLRARASCASETSQVPQKADISRATTRPGSVTKISATKENTRRPAATGTTTNAPRVVLPETDGRDVVDEEKRVSVYSNVSSSTSSKASRQLKTHVGPWQLGKTLGQGSSGRVRAARHTVTRLPAAVKIVSKKTSHLTQAPSLANLDHIDKSQPLSVDGVRRMPLAIEREIAIMKLTEHPNIVKLYDIWENRSEM